MKKIKRQIRVAEKQYQQFGNDFEPNKEEEKTKSKRSRAQSNLVCNKYFTFYKYSKIKEFAKRSFDSKRHDLKELEDDLELLCYETIEIKANNERKIKNLEEI